MAILFDLTSLRGKITSAYVALVLGTAALGAVAFWDLLFLQRQVTEGAVVSDLKDAVLEMRREEKNLFLYGTEDIFSRVDDQAQGSLKILRDYRVVLNSIMRKSDFARLQETLDAYRSRLAHWPATPAGEGEALRGQIRALGHQAYLAVDSLSKTERRMLEATVQKYQWFLLLSLSMIGLSIVLVGRRLKRVVVTPLKQLHHLLRQIAKGRFNHLEPPSNDREFVTFTNAFNRMLQELETRHRRMLQSEKLASLGILAAGVAHELNNPLSNISSSCQLLMEELTEADPAQLTTWLKQIDAETERGQRIVRALLDFGGQRIFRKSLQRLPDIINETRIIIDNALQRETATLTVNVPDDLMVDVDKQRFQQLLINLIQNALHAGGQGVHVRLSAISCTRSGALIPDGAEVAGNLGCVTDYDGRCVELLVSDDGPGIRAENLSKVFDPFFTTREPGHGVGLGLSIVQEIVREHDGCLAIASKPGKGTQVIVLLPGEGPRGD